MVKLWLFHLMALLTLTVVGKMYTTTVHGICELYVGGIMSIFACCNRNI